MSSGAELSGHRGRKSASRRPWVAKRGGPVARRPWAEPLEDRRLLSLFTVTNTSDDGLAGSLRFAIGQANGDATATVAAPHQIRFAIPASDPGFVAATGQWKIAPTSALPTLTRPVIIDGYSQGAGATRNTGDLQHADNAVLTIELSGAGAGPGANGLVLGAGSGGSTIEGLIIDGFRQGGAVAGVGGNGILVSAQDCVIAGNFLGFNPLDPNASGNDLSGVNVAGLRATIGGTTPDARNVISGNKASGVLFSAGSSGGTVEGNFIGTSVLGTAGLANGRDGVELAGLGGVVVGGSAPGAPNVIAFNQGVGVSVSNSATNLSNLIGRNAIFGNTSLGIDLGRDGVTANTPNGPHVGPNDLQNYPVLDAFTVSGGQTTVTGSLNGAPGQAFTIEFFANPTADLSGHGEGQTFLGALTNIQTDANGNAPLQFTTAGDLTGQFITATATDPVGDTSEFAQDVQAAPTSADLSVVAGTPTTGGNPSQMIYALTVTNNGPDDALSVTLTDVLPAGSTFVSENHASPFTINAPAVGDPGPIVFTAPLLAANATATFRITVQLDPGTPGGTQITNAATLGSATSDPDTTNNTARAQATTLAPTVTKLTASGIYAFTNQPVTFTATVTPQTGTGTPTGTVTFSIDGQGFPAALQLVNGQPQATFTVATFSVGPHMIAASYNGDAHFSISSDALSMGVTVSLTPPESLAATSTALTGPSGPTTFGQPATFTAIVSTSGLTTAATGSVTFLVDGQPQATVNLSTVGGRSQASFTTTNLSLQPAQHTLIAIYNGDATRQGSTSAPFTQQVVPVPPVMTPTPTPAPTPTGDGPRVTSVLRFGFHSMPTTVQVGFNAALDPSRAQDVNNYRIVGPDGQGIAIASASYNAATNTVTLAPQERLDLHQSFSLTLVGTGPGGLAGTSGRLLDGAGNGQPGSDFQTSLTAANLVLGANPPIGPTALAKLRKTVARLASQEGASHGGRTHHRKHHG